MPFLVLITAMSTFAAPDRIPAEQKTDSRLEQKITYTAKSELLYKVLKQLTRETGVTMKCGKNDIDWQVRDRKVNIFIKDMPLKDLQKSLADVLHFTWASTDKDGTIAYRLFQTRKQREEEEAIRQEALSILPKKRQEAISQIEKLDSMSPEEIEKLRTEDPWLYFLAKDPDGKNILQVIKAIPEVKQALIDNRKMRIPISTLPPSGVAAAMSLVAGAEGLNRRIIPSEEGDDEPAIAPEDISSKILEAEIVVNSDINRNDPGIPEGSILGIVEIDGEGFDSSNCISPLLDPKSPLAKTLIRGLTSGATEEAIEKYMADATAEKIAKDQKVDALPDDPDMKKHAKLTAGSNSLPDVLEQIAANIKLQVVSDDFRYRPQAECKADGTLEDILKSISGAFEKDIKKDDNLLTLVDRRWAVKRSWEVPEIKLAYWRKHVNDNTFSFWDLIDVAHLTDDQVENTVLTDETLYDLDCRQSSRSFLRFYSTLSPDQRDAVASDSGLPITELNAEQYKVLHDLLSDDTPSTTIDQDKANICIKGQYLDKINIFAVENTAAQPNDDGAIEQDSTDGQLGSWLITLPGAMEDEDEGAPAYDVPQASPDAPATPPYPSEGTEDQ